MRPEQSFKNIALFEAKRALLQNLKTQSKTILESHSYISSFDFHGFVLNFYSADSEFANSILSFLPSCWKKQLGNKSDSKDNLNIYLINNWQSDWDLEENPECFIDRAKDFETAIQRDFVGIDYKDDIVVALEAIHGDGIFNVLRWLLPRRMVKKGYFLLHSSCVVEDGKAYFFLGHSGAGKSTLATLSGNRMVLGDDMNVMRLENGKVFARAGGLGGMSFKSTDFENEYPVAGFHWLIQDDKNLKHKMKSSQAVSKLLASLANVFWEFLSDSEKESLMDLAMNVVSASEFNELHFTKTQECWNNVI